MRVAPRFEKPTLVSLALPDQTALSELWARDISKGGIFVETANPPPLRTPIEVVLALPEGAVALKAEVVHVLNAEAAAKVDCAPGVGLAFLDLPRGPKEALERYLASEPTAEDASSEVVQAMTHFLRHFEAEDLYAATKIEPTATRPEAASRLEYLLRLFQEAPASLSPAQKTRLGRAKALLKKATVLLIDPERRLDYDFRHGHIYAEDRVRNAQSADALQQMRQVWHRVFPDQLALAESHAAVALQFEAIKRWEQAIAAGREALASDPFNLELRQTLVTWHEQLERQRLATV